MYPSPIVPQHVVHHNRGPGFSLSGASGIIPAALAANSLVFAMLCATQAAVQLLVDECHWVEATQSAM